MDLSQYSVRHFDRGASRIKEAMWLLVRWFFFLNPLPWPSALRVALLRAFGASIGRGVVIKSDVNITFPWRLSLGDHVWLGEGVLILSLAPITIESSVCISQRAFLCAGSHDFRSPTFDLQTKPIIVRSSCWIAAQAFVGPGVEIGSGSVLSAGSVALENIPPDSLARGNPAVVARNLSHRAQP